MDKRQRPVKQIESKWAWYALAGVLFVFACFKIYFHNIKFSDGPIYLYMASRFLHGELPYRDFLYANPLGHLLALTPWVALFEDYAQYLNLLAGLAHMGSAVLVFRYVRIAFASPLVALLTATSFLFSFSVIATSDHLTGVHISIFWIILTANLMLSDRPYWAAAAGACSLLTRFYCLPWMAAIFIGGFFKNRKAAWKFGWTMSGIFFVGMGFHFLISPQDVYNQLFKYHLLKQEGIPKPRIIRFFFVHDGLIFAGLLGFPFLFKRRILTPILGTLLCMSFLYFFIDIYYFYLLPSVLGLAICCGALFATIEQKFKNKISKIALCAAVAGYVGFSIHNYFDNTHIADSVENMKEIVNFIHTNSTPEQTIFGTAEITPLIALMSHRKITGTLADTNVKTVLTGIINPAERFRKVLNLGVKFVVTGVSLDSKGQPQGLDLLIPPTMLLENCKVAQGIPLRFAQAANFLIIWNCQK